MLDENDPYQTEKAVKVSPFDLTKRLSSLLLTDDSVPVKILSSKDGVQNKYRKRSWFTAVLGYIDLAVSLGYIKKSETIQLYRQRKAQWTQGKFTNREVLVTPEDIQQANTLIRLALMDIVQDAKAGK